jgi:phospholipase/carboxylesterase
MLLVHGYGGSPDDVRAIVPYIDPAGRFVVVCPRAPNRVPGAGWRWYTSDPHGHDARLFHASLGALDDLVDDLCAGHGLQRSEAVFSGISQGSSMAYALALGPFRPRPAGVVAMSGFLVDVDGFEYDWEADDLPPVLIQHGVRDRSYPIPLLRRLETRLRGHGVPVVVQEYPMAHEVTRASLADQAAWLAALVTGDTASPPAPPT